MKAIRSEIEQPLGRMLSRTGKDFLSILCTKLKGLDLKRNFYALILIEEGKNEITQQDLAFLLNTDKVSIVRIIDYLSSKGYVKRVRNSFDRRKYSLVLTNKAKKEIPQIKKSLKETKNIALKGLNDSRIREFYRTLNLVKRNLSEINAVL
jgi:MarR family transcriptional regulator, transcriptional regulator for hemolysin